MKRDRDAYRMPESIFRFATHFITLTYLFSAFLTAGAMLISTGDYMLDEALHQRPFWGWTLLIASGIGVLGVIVDRISWTSISFLLMSMWYYGFTAALMSDLFNPHHHVELIAPIIVGTMAVSYSLIGVLKVYGWRRDFDE